MARHPTSISFSDQEVVNDVIMRMDPAEDLDEREAATFEPGTDFQINEITIEHSKYKMPDWRHPKGFLYLAWDVKYGKFVADVQAMNAELINRDTMEMLWAELLYRYYELDDTGIKAVMDLALDDALGSVTGYEGFDAEGYWRLQSVTSDLGQLLSGWQSKERQEYQSRISEVVAPIDHQEDHETTMVMTNGGSEGQPTLSGPLSERCGAPSQYQAVYTTAPAYVSYVHPGILRRKIDESYEFDEEEDDQEMA
ncbi:hypothetical protein WAI453_008440 [Rhynchosporium graminicola]|uniref:Uncharacterized protein n=1 Tax=Rhynchosporium graminicola TaxID=2792576 RepID=A0A1E1KQ06_9HELO|nr:uncharacterized protein RCO7_00386 [Rhynchosporium commune]